MLAFFAQPVLGQVVAELVVADAERTCRARLIALRFAERVGKEGIVIPVPFCDEQLSGSRRPEPGRVRNFA